MIEIPLWFWTFILGACLMNELHLRKDNILKWLEIKSIKYNENRKEENEINRTYK